MKYTFKDMLNAEIYDNVRVMFILGKYSWFNNMISDTIKSMCESNAGVEVVDLGIDAEFGLDTSDEDKTSTSVDFTTFMAVNNVKNINGKWICKVNYSLLNSKQKEQIKTYLKSPSENGVLIVVSDNWLEYKEILKHRVLNISNNCHSIQLDFPNRKTLKKIVEMAFEEKGIEIASDAVDLFIMKMSTVYDEYEDMINYVADLHSDKKDSKITAKELREYMSGIDNYVVDDFIIELTKPLTSDKTNKKKVLKIMATLVEEHGAFSLVKQIMKKVNESIEYRLLINDGYIPIGINYFYKDILNGLPNPSKYEKVSEWQFRKKADLASKTSLRDWEYIKLILTKALEQKVMADSDRELKCKIALYEVATRSVATKSRLNNIIRIENVLNNDLDKINRIKLKY